MTGRYILLGADGRPQRSAAAGTLGGHRRGRIYGRLDCPSALRAIARGGYAAQRVFFADQAAAVAAGYRPCAVCLPGAYRAWKHQRNNPRGRGGAAALAAAALDIGLFNRPSPPPLDTRVHLSQNQTPR